MKRAESAWILSVSVAALICGSAKLHAQESGKLPRSRVAVPSRSTAYFPFIFAKKHGYYLKEGVDFEMIQMRPTISSVALVSGDLDFSTTTNRDLGAALGGLPVKIVMALTTAWGHVLVAKPEIRTMKDLKGKIIGIDGPRQVLEVLARRGLERHGLVPEVDVKFLAMGGAGTDVRFSSLVSGRVDATLLGAPHNLMAAKQGYNLLFAAKDVSKMISASLATTTQKIQREPKAIIGTIKVTLQAVQFLKENKNEFLRMLAEETGVKDKETGEALFEDFVTTQSDTGVVPDESLLESISFIKELQGITRAVAVSDVVDWSFARKVQELRR
jgi:NitT/TauT family transport system substrate-binding protein